MNSRSHHPLCNPSCVRHRQRRRCRPPSRLHQHQQQHHHHFHRDLSRPVALSLGMCLRLAGTMSAMSMPSHFQRPLPQREAARQPVQEGVPGDAPAKRQRTQSQSRTTAHLITLSPRTSRSMTRPCPTGRLMSLPHPCQRGVLGPVWKSHDRSFPPCPLSLVHHHSMSSMRPSSPHPRRLHRAMATHLCEPALAHLCPSCPCRRQPLCTLILRDQLMCSSLLPKNAPHSDRLTVAPTRRKYISPARHRRTRLS